MRAGQLRHTIIIQRLTATNTGGVITHAWAEYDTVRAEVIQPPARFAASEFWAAQQVQDEEAVTFKIRYLSGVTQKMRVLYNYKAYDIKGVVDVKGRGREMMLIATIDPQEYSTFTYGDISITAGENAGDIIFTWSTDFYSSSDVRFKEQLISSWTDRDEADTDPRVLSHSFTVTNMKADADYDVQIWSANGAGWTPGWSDTVEFSLDLEYQVEID